MPYSSNKDLPPNIRKLSDKQQSQWRNIWNNTYEKCKSKGGKDCEGKAFRVANGVVKGKD